MILAYWDDQWVLCGRGPAHGAGCGIGVRPALIDWASARGLKRHGPDPTLSKAKETLEDVRFYPEIRYRGNKVHPVCWHPTAAEPILRVFAQTLSGVGYFHANPPTTADEFYRAMRADGWAFEPREGWMRDCHVDELEKIEGPPPEGPF